MHYSWFAIIGLISSITKVQAAPAYSNGKCIPKSISTSSVVSTYPTTTSPTIYSTLSPSATSVLVIELPVKSSVPAVYSVPAVPSVPTVPSVPAVPVIQSVPTVPSVPVVPIQPSVPAATSYIQGILDEHNLARSAAGASPALLNLVWDTDLATSSLSWSLQLASNGGGLVHSGDHSFGENLAANYAKSASDPNTGKVASQMWYSEKSLYLSLGSPAVSNDPTFEGFGHYTQMVWRNSVKVGCGSAAVNGGKYTVTTCRYSPPGNYIGSKPF